MKVSLNPFRGQFSELPSRFLLMLDRSLEKLAQKRKLNVVIFSTDYTIVETDEFLIYTGAGGNTVTLPNAVAFDGYSFQVKNAGPGNLTINGGTLATGVGTTLIAGNGAWQSIP